MERAIEIIRQVFTIVLWLLILVSWYTGDFATAILSGIILVVLELEKINDNLEK
jgi:diacylglycerol kinase